MGGFGLEGSVGSDIGNGLQKNSMNLGSVIPGRETGDGESSEVPPICQFYVIYGHDGGR